MKKIIILCFALGAFHTLGAQETLTLSQCLQMAVDNNLSLQSSRNEIAKGKYAISENQAKLYPQINAVAQLNDNFTPPVSVTDGSAYGKPYNVTKTLQYNASAGVQFLPPSISPRLPINSTNSLMRRRVKTSSCRLPRCITWRRTHLSRFV